VNRHARYRRETSGTLLTYLVDVDQPLDVPTLRNATRSWLDALPRRMRSCIVCSGLIWERQRVGLLLLSAPAVAKPPAASVCGVCIECADLPLAALERAATAALQSVVPDGRFAPLGDTAMKPQRPSIFADAVVDGRGHRSNETLLRLDERDRYLIEAARFFPACSDRETARQLLTALKTYSAGRWRRDAVLALCPPQYAGTYRRLFWAILKLHDHVPCDRAVRTALARAQLLKNNLRPAFRCPPSDG
jgi:hypothetical protein